MGTPMLSAEAKQKLTEARKAIGEGRAEQALAYYNEVGEAPEGITIYDKEWYIFYYGMAQAVDALEDFDESLREKGVFQLAKEQKLDEETQNLIKEELEHYGGSLDEIFIYIKTEFMLMLTMVASESEDIKKKFVAKATDDFLASFDIYNKAHTPILHITGILLHAANIGFDEVPEDEARLLQKTAIELVETKYKTQRLEGNLLDADKKLEIIKPLGDNIIKLFGEDPEYIAVAVKLWKETVFLRHTYTTFRHPQDKDQVTWYDQMIEKIKKYDSSYEAPQFGQPGCREMILDSTSINKLQPGE